MENFHVITSWLRSTAHFELTISFSEQLFWIVVLLVSIQGIYPTFNDNSISIIVNGPTNFRLQYGRRLTETAYRSVRAAEKSPVSLAP